MEKTLCPPTKTDTVKEGEQIVATGNGNNAIVLETVGGKTESANFGPWILVEKKSRRNPRGNRGFGAEIKGNNFFESRYIILNYANQKGCGFEGILKETNGHEMEMLDNNKRGCFAGL
ncbi:hypothetical protein GOBAR_AA21865 [Gossypium barbadense]|uniref:Uncharacterized protein n=1 Tax=Gossypium barbadense TaxID=3634 RepID=A0A2P5X655_GOSBA|nr:hypothetical protein GOBAR_AA21865 [Gossypium barbadense]